MYIYIYTYTKLYPKNINVYTGYVENVDSVCEPFTILNKNVQNKGNGI